jgi:hypothetical protein
VPQEFLRCFTIRQRSEGADEAPKESYNLLVTRRRATYQYDLHVGIFTGLRTLTDDMWIIYVAVYWGRTLAGPRLAVLILRVDTLLPACPASRLAIDIQRRADVREDE